jgi:hypothetical protein
MTDLAQVAATVIHVRGETSMGFIPMGDWMKMQEAVNELWERPGAKTIFFGTMRLDNPTPTPYPLPLPLPPVPVGGEDLTQSPA